MVERQMLPWQINSIFITIKFLLQYRDLPCFARFSTLFLLFFLNIVKIRNLAQNGIFLYSLDGNQCWYIGKFVPTQFSLNLLVFLDFSFFIFVQFQFAMLIKLTIQIYFLHDFQFFHLIFCIFKTYMRTYIQRNTNL